MNRLENLCRPLILLVCEYCNCARAGAQIDIASMRGELLNTLDDIKRKCEADALLQRDFQRVEQPLIFFIDYMIKEGNFPFSKAWVPIARSYKELSGDEKFFDQLQTNLDDPEACDSLQMFHLLMGLGFDGCYKNDREYVARRMKLCAVRCHANRSLTAEDLCSSTQPETRKRYSVRYHSKTLKYVLISCSLFALIGLAWNFYRLEQISREGYMCIRSIQRELNRKMLLSSGRFSNSDAVRPSEVKK